MTAIISIVNIAPSLCLSFIALLTASMLVASTSARPPPMGCTTRKLLLLSPCLPFISAPPNNLSATVPSTCCEAFSSAYNSGGGICLCYFLREPQILGFPLNSTKLISLSLFCPISREKNGSLESLCSESQALPPLQSSKIPGTQGHPDSPARKNASSSMGFPPARAPSAIIPPRAPSAPANKPPPPRSSATAKSVSAAKDCTDWFLPGLLIFLVQISIHL